MWFDMSVWDCSFSVLFRGFICLFVYFVCNIHGRCGGWCSLCDFGSCVTTAGLVLGTLWPVQTRFYPYGQLLACFFFFFLIGTFLGGCDPTFMTDNINGFKMCFSLQSGSNLAGTNAVNISINITIWIIILTTFFTALITPFLCRKFSKWLWMGSG